MKLSVVIVAREGGDTLERCLDSVENLPERPDIEVIVVRADSRESLAHARARGIRDASSEVVAVLGERYRVSKDWARVIVEAHRRDFGVIGGCVAPLAPSRIGAWSIFLWEYLHAAPPMPSGELEQREAILLPGGNTSYKRNALEALDMATFRWELDHHAALFAKGIRFSREAKMLVSYEPPLLRQYIAERFRLSCDLAEANAANLGLVSKVARIALPVFLLARVIARTIRKPRYGARVILCFPLLIGFSLIQTAGELTGYFGYNDGSP